MTPKQRVTRKWKSARCEKTYVSGWSGEYDYAIKRDSQKTQFGTTLIYTEGTGPTPAAAWADAARRMK